MTKPSETKVSRCVLCHQVYGPGADQQPKTAEQIAELERQNAELLEALKTLREAIPAHLLVAHAAIPLDPQTGYQCGEPAIQTLPRLQSAAIKATAALASKEPE